MSVFRKLLGALKRVVAFFRAHTIELGLGIRVTAAALTALVVALTIGLKLPLWAVLTSIIVTQMSVGRSLKATRDYLIGTVGGALYGGAVAILIPHSNEGMLLLVLVLAVLPLAFIAAINASLNVAPVTAIIVLLLPLMNHNTPLESAIDRVLEVTVGAITGLLVSFIVLPSRAHSQVRANAAQALDLIATALTELLAALTRGRDNETLHRLQDGIGLAITSLQAIGAEAERERAAHLSRGPDTGPLLRTTLRLRHDLVMIGRSTVVPLPSPLQIRLVGPLARVSEAMATFLHSTAVALRSGTGAPAIYPVQSALKLYGEEVAKLRQEGLTRGLPGDMAERFFAIGFSLEQMRQNLRDLERCVSEWAEVDPPMRGRKVQEITDAT
ncbi:MAG: FUSC family protein [Bradyrhizobiaceae bacterium]|nr:MAG: FUSC family protein [Bradyrhizobiaceae bacterium]